MPSWLSIALTIFYASWLCAVLTFLWMIWRRGVQHTQQLEQTLVKAALDAAKAAEKASEAAFVLACKKPVTMSEIIEGGPPVP